MSSERWRRLEALYEAASELPADQRARFLDEQCRDDAELRHELTVMFQETGGITTIVGQAAAAVTKASPDPWMGKKLGPYRLLRPIGQGGMGAVYEGQREEGFQKRVAIKLVRYSFDSDFARRRFQEERQILARLEHPNIARLLDGGDYEGRFPYLVMEFVEGRPLLAAASSLGTRAKLRLFQKILSAASNAHRELIVHRDIKPANILVAADGEPKLLDFGIARLIGEDAAGRKPQTMTVGSMMTPDYASPEQVKGEPAGVASDIYSLGATLYELLSGERAHELGSYSAAELYRVICETDVRPPSALAKDPQLQRELKGDLDTLVLHAMAKEPAARYSSAEAFSAEIERYLAGRPLTVRPATALERAWKFVKRNKLSVAATAALAASLVGGITVSTIEARRAQRRFAQVRELANTFLFQFYDQVTPLPGSTEVRRSIVDTARKYLDGLASEAGNDKGLILELAQAYERLGDVQTGIFGGSGGLGQVEEARRSYNKAIGLYGDIPVRASSTAELRLKLATVWYRLGRLEYSAENEEVAESDTRSMLDLLTDAGRDPAAQMLKARGQSSLGQIRARLGHPAEGVRWLEGAERIFGELKASGHTDPGLATNTDINHERLIGVKVALGDLDEAARLAEERIRTAEPCEEQNPSRDACRSLAYRFEKAGDVYGVLDRPNLEEPAKAAEFYQQSIEALQRVAAMDLHDRQARFSLAANHGKLGDAVWESDPERALQLYDQALAMAKELVSKEQFLQLKEPHDSAIARPLITLGRLGEARTLLEQLLVEAHNEAQSSFLDAVGEFIDRQEWASLLIAEGKRPEARQYLHGMIADLDKMRAGHPEDLTLVYFLAKASRLLASIADGQERRDVLLHSAAAWHSWPSTSYTARQEQKDLAAANR